MTKKTESEPIQLTNHEKNLLRKIARQFAIEDAIAYKAAQKAIIKQEDKEDAPFRRKIVK